MIKNKIGAVFCAFAVVLWFMAGILLNASADEEANGSLTLWCVKDDDIVSDMHWQLYRVGHRENNDYVFEGDFAGYRATLGDETKPMLEWDTDTVAAAGDALKKKTIADKIEARDEGYTNSAGAVTFDGLENGLYLVWGDILVKGDTTYIPSAIFFEMNGDDEAVLNAYPKIVLRTLSGEVFNYSVRKVWQNDESQPWNRSVSITVERYRDDQYYDEIILSEDNDWTFVWEDDSAHTWFVYEKVIPEHYTVSYKENHTQYLIINTFSDTIDSSMTDIHTTATSADNSTHIQTTVTTAAQQTNTATDVGGTKTTENISGTTLRTTQNTQTTTVKQVTTVTEEKIPQTGQLWWPVPALALGGILMLGIGLRLTQKDDEE